MKTIFAVAVGNVLCGKDGEVGMITISTMDSLPEHCYECPCHDGESGYCQADKANRYSDYRPFWCPLKEQDGLLGMIQTAEGITFISTGTVKEGEERGLLFGKKVMHEWLQKELLYRGLLTDEIRDVFNEAERL